MKIAVPTKDQVVDNHFGHCEYYTIYRLPFSSLLQTFWCHFSPGFK